MAKSAPQPDNDDLVEAALAVQDGIRGAYQNYEEHCPVMLYDLEEARVYALPYDGYRETLSEHSQTQLAEDYERARRNDQIVVFVRDSQTRRLVSFLLDRKTDEPS